MPPGPHPPARRCLRLAGARPSLQRHCPHLPGLPRSFSSLPEPRVAAPRLPGLYTWLLALGGPPGGQSHVAPDSPATRGAPRSREGGRIAMRSLFTGVSEQIVLLCPRSLDHRPQTTHVGQGKTFPHPFPAPLKIREQWTQPVVPAADSPPAAVGPSSPGIPGPWAPEPGAPHPASPPRAAPVRTGRASSGGQATCPQTQVPLDPP